MAAIRRIAIIVGGLKPFRKMVKDLISRRFCIQTDQDFSKMSECFRAIHGMEKLDLVIVTICADCANSDMDIGIFMSTISGRWPDAEFIVLRCSGDVPADIISLPNVRVSQPEGEDFEQIMNELGRDKIKK